MDRINNVRQAYLFALVTVIIILFLSEFPIFKSTFEKYEKIFYDISMDLNWKLKSGRQKKVIEDIVIIDIDARSVNKLGKFSFWPRLYWADLIKNLAEAKVKAIGIDVLFDPDIRHPDEDKIFLNSVRNAGNVITAIYIAPSDSDRFMYKMKSLPSGFPESAAFKADNEFNVFPKNDRIEPEFPQLASASKSVGHVGMDPDRDGVLRSIYPFYRFNDLAFPGFSLSIINHILNIDSVQIHDSRIQLYSGGVLKSSIPFNKAGKYNVLFHGPYQSFRYISFYDVMTQRIDLSYFRNKIVLIGTSLPALFDLRSVPVQQQFPGVEIHANVIYDILNNLHVNTLPWYGKYLIILVLTFVVALLVGVLRPLQSIIITLALVVAYFISMVFIFSNFLIWIPFFSILLSIIILIILDFSYKYLTEEKNKKIIKDIFSHYVSKNVAEVLLEKPDLVKLGGEKKNCTVLFSDIENFTNLSEKLEPEFLVQIINEYHSEMTELVFLNNGFLDKYEGDAIMAVYGAPVDIGNHALMACKTAIQMNKRLKMLQSKWAKENKPVLKCRIGVNSGPMIVGNMGSKERFDYTVMGDAVNLGARLESANKNYGSRILIGEKTYEMAKDEIIARKLDLIQVKGRMKPTFVYQLLELKPNDSEELQLRVALFEKGFELYLQRKWDLAIQYFQKLLESVPSDFQARVFLQRCQYFKEFPPSEDWNGVYIMSQK
ncbi:MAG: adenylate/guanylate cyclase domain-containing protein [Calditrichia bacterium]